MIVRLLNWLLGPRPEDMPVVDPNQADDIGSVSFDDILLRLGMEDGYNPNAARREWNDEDDVNNFYLSEQEMNDGR